MAYFAELDNQNLVVRVVAVSDNEAPDPAPNDQAGNHFLNSIGLIGQWVQTSFNNRIRKQFAGIGYRYDAQADVFISPQPFPSWTLDQHHDWQPPIPYPSDDQKYQWDEERQEWIES